MLCIGIDGGKRKHIAAFINKKLLGQHQKFDKCPTHSFDNSPQGFESLRIVMAGYAPLSKCHVLLEHTGHYHQPLVEYLQAQGIAVYLIHIQASANNSKSDKGDALRLANTLYGQIALGVQVNDKSQAVRRLVPPSEASTLLRSLVRHRYELGHEITQRMNQGISIIDQLFPEFTRVFKDPNLSTALAIREALPTPAHIAQADIATLCALRTGHRPGKADLEKLKELAKNSIGIKEPGRVRGLCFEQAQLIKELRLLQENLAALDAEIDEVIGASREGQILTSIPCINTTTAAGLIATIGSIGNFPSMMALRTYLGWAPRQSQTGTSKDSMKLGKGGNRPIKQAIYLVAWGAITHDTEFKAVYDRLVPLKCVYDARRGKYTGKNKPLGRIAGQIIGLIYSLLRQDYDRLAKLQPGEEPPTPTLYDREIHHAHRVRRQHKEEMRALREINA